MENISVGPTSPVPSEKTDLLHILRVGHFRLWLDPQRQPRGQGWPQRAGTSEAVAVIPL